MKIRVLNAPEYKAGIARAKWFAAVKRHDGKDVDSFMQNATKRPPALTKSGEAEPPAGGLRYFVRQEVVELVVSMPPQIVRILPG